MHLPRLEVLHNRLATLLSGIKLSSLVSSVFHAICEAARYTMVYNKRLQQHWLTGSRWLFNNAYSEQNIRGHFPIFLLKISLTLKVRLYSNDKYALLLKHETLSALPLMNWEHYFGIRIPAVLFRDPLCKRVANPNSKCYGVSALILFFSIVIPHSLCISLLRYLLIFGMIWWTGLKKNNIR